MKSTLAENRAGYGCLNVAMSRASIKYLKRLISGSLLPKHMVFSLRHQDRSTAFSPLFTVLPELRLLAETWSLRQVWSSKEGYPGDFAYRDFYRDVGFDLDYDYVKPYLHGDGKRGNLGIKYYRITGKTDHKAPILTGSRP